MTFENFKQRFLEKANQSNYSEENIKKCLDYAEPIINRNLPVIFNTSHLSQLVGYRKTFIKKAVLYPDYFYRSFQIIKKNGEPRNLKEPLPSLKEIQYWILENILYQLPVSRFAKAYIRKRNLFENVKYHKNKKVVICLDIKNFFSSIKRDEIEKVFLALGYSSNISNLLSKLCCLNNCLPQGAPTSPFLSNIYMYEFDHVISTYCTSSNIRYSRYADDLTFSGDLNPGVVIAFVKAELLKIGLLLNEDKIKIMGKNVRQIVTGIVVNDKFQIPKEKRNKIRQEIFFIKKFGLENHLRNTNSNRGNYVKHLFGKINFALYFNPSDKEMKGYFEYMKTLV
jgi:RNA-directed DNA polymerase